MTPQRLQLLDPTRKVPPSSNRKATGLKRLLGNVSAHRLPGKLTVGSARDVFAWNRHYALLEDLSTKDDATFVPCLSLMSVMIGGRFHCDRWRKSVWVYRSYCNWKCLQRHLLHAGSAQLRAGPFHCFPWVVPRSISWIWLFFFALLSWCFFLFGFLLVPLPDQEILSTMGLDIWFLSWIDLLTATIVTMSSNEKTTTGSCPVPICVKS